MSADTLNNRLNALAISLGVAIRRRSELRQRNCKLKHRLLKLRAGVANRKKALLVIEYLIGKKYDKVIALFEKTVTSALMDLFDEDYSFKFLLGRHGDNTTCEFGINTGKYKGYIPVRMTQGNSIKEIISVIISTVVVRLDKQMPKFILLDEKLGGVSAKRQSVAANFLKRICKTFGVQYIVVTQSEEFASMADNLIKLESRS